MYRTTSASWRGHNISENQPDPMKSVGATKILVQNGPKKGHFGGWFFWRGGGVLAENFRLRRAIKPRS